MSSSLITSSCGKETPVGVSVGKPVGAEVRLSVNLEVGREERIEALEGDEVN